MRCSDVLSLGKPPLHIIPFFLYTNSYQSSGIEESTSQEQYYEVPHWMHLSFVSYESDEAVFVDHLYEAEEKKRDRKLVANSSGLNIAANGFLLTTANDVLSNEVQSQENPTLRPISFTARGNAAASPSRKPRAGSSERQLIEGRDFADILEACRPRSARSSPSALKALLQFNNGERIVADEVRKESEGVQCVDEWGRVDFDLFQGDSSDARLGRRSLSGGRLDEAIAAPHLSGSPHRAIASSHGSTQDCDRGQEVSSHASSFASQVSSAGLGLLCDLPPSIAPISSSSTAGQLQRSASLTIDIEKDDESFAFLNSESAGASSDDDDLVDPRMKDKTETFVARMRLMMRAHEESMSSIPPPNLVARAEPSRAELENMSATVRRRVAKATQTKLQSGSTTNNRYGHGSQVIAAGGLGAALTQYKFTNSNFVGDGDRGNSTLLARTTSMVGTSGSGRQPSLGSTGQSFRTEDLGWRGLSPLLLPPVASTKPAVSDPVHVAPPEQILMQRRILHPEEYSTSRGAAVRVSTRATGMISDINMRDGDKKSSSRSLSVSPPKNSGSASKDKTARLRITRDLYATSKPSSQSRHRGSATPSRVGVTSRKKKVFNPFRQRDEEEVLAMKSHNRLRWSHVFPLGEVEFKRHAGPNWKSLTAPAILPLSIDYYPQQDEIEHSFTTGFHNVTLGEFEHRNYSSNKDLLVEMVRQRLTQDYQLVPNDCINTSNYRKEAHRGRRTSERSADAQEEGPGVIRQFLSMGHRLQACTYYPSTDVIEVYRYDAAETQKNSTFSYPYFSFCQETQNYSKAHQTFSKYSDLYNWNKVDNIICGDDDREMREGMRFKRVMFGIIPENFHNDLVAEEAYVAKFRRFLEYLEKLRDKDESETSLDIKFVTSVDKQYQEESKRMESRPGVERDSMVRFYIQLRKGKRDNLEWMEVALDSTFDTYWTYRIMFNWLVASSGKVDTQVQLLQRRCTQYGLKLVPVPQITVSRNLYLNPFKAPAFLTIRHKIDALRLDRALSLIEFVHDGMFPTDVGAVLECLDDCDAFHFETRRGILRPAMGKQVAHRSGTLFVRVLTDLNGFAVLVVLGNYRYMLANKDEAVLRAYQGAFKYLTECVASFQMRETVEPDISNDEAPQAANNSDSSLEPDSALDQTLEPSSTTESKLENGGPLEAVEIPAKTIELIVPEEALNPRGCIPRID